MAEYLLDTNHISPLVTLGHPLRDKILSRLQAGDIFSIIFPALHEFLFGISILPCAEQNLHEWRQLKGLFKYYQLDEGLVEKSVELRVLLRYQGWQLEIIDSFIAVTALQNDLVLLTTDKDFHAVPKLRHENWR
jgi:tRNA(fMet)-specific endonuclease VapC